MAGGGGRGAGAPAGRGGAALADLAGQQARHCRLPDPRHPPATRLIDAVSGKVVAELARERPHEVRRTGPQEAEMFTYLAADGKTQLRGVISFPSNFDPSKKYPALASVYGGPAFARRA